MYSTREKHRSASISSNVLNSPKDPAPVSRSGFKIGVGLPFGNFRSFDNGNKPLNQIDQYETNSKTVVAEFFKRKNYNEQNNLKNSLYVSERSPKVDSEALTIFGYDKIYLEETDDANRRANILSPSHIKTLENREKKLRNFLKRTEEIVDNRREKQIAKSFNDLETQKEELQKVYNDMQRAVKRIVKAENSHDTYNKFADLDLDNIVKKGDFQKIKGAHRSTESVLDKTTNIRQVLGFKSDEVQEKIRKAEEERERREAEEAARRAEELRKEKERVDKLTDVKILQQKWRIWDDKKLKMTIRNEIVKQIMRDEEKKNYKEIAERKFKPQEDDRKKLKAKIAALEKKKKENKENEREKQLMKETAKQAAWGTGKLQKKKDESQADFTKRLALFNLPKAKKKPNAFRSHSIFKNFIDLAVDKAAEINGGIELKA